MKTKMSNIPSHKGYQTAIEFKCDFCGATAWERRSHYARKKRHFCSRVCYSEFRKNRLPLSEQHAYKGIRKEGESKQVYHKRYCKKNPEIISHLKSRRYAVEKNAEGNHSLLEWNQLKLKYHNKCAHCGNIKKLTKDHIIPLSKGGTDYISNIQPLCRNCNSKKWNHIYQNPGLLNND